MDACEHSSDLKRPLYVRKNKEGKMPVFWTYSVEWVLDNEHDWRTRWDVYFDAGSGGDEVHWFSIINALVIVLFLSGMVGMILMRSLHRDISRYNRVPTEEERAEEREESMEACPRRRVPSAVEAPDAVLRHGGHGLPAAGHGARHALLRCCWRFGAVEPW